MTLEEALKNPDGVALMSVEMNADWTEAAVTTLVAGQCGIVEVPHANIDALDRVIGGRPVLTHTSGEVAAIYHDADRPLPNLFDIRIKDGDSLVSLAAEYGVTIEDDEQDCVAVNEMMVLVGIVDTMMERART
ncbi:MAG: hypothetical protein K2Z25_19315 [Beijerinckiaceae bacterium]|nr:hypothetical protein [Beijerinckiaceae bacterium]